MLIQISNLCNDNEIMNYVAVSERIHIHKIDYCFSNEMISVSKFIFFIEQES